MTTRRRSAAAASAATPLSVRLFRLLALLAGLIAAIAGGVLLAAPAWRIGSIERITIGATPATVYLPVGEERGAAVVIAHGFAGSQQLMEAFALAQAQSGLRAITFDFPGHGQSLVPMAGGQGDREARTAQLSAALDEVVRYAETRFGGPIGLLGHSMGSEVVTRYAQERPQIEATIAVSLVYSGVTPVSPRNLLVLTGVWEPQLTPLAQAVADGAAGGAGATGVTYGSFADGTARRVVLVQWAEHVAVLFSGESMAESTGWLQAALLNDDTSTAGEATGSGFGSVASRLPALGLLYLGAVLLFWPLAALIQPIGPVAGPLAPLSRRVWWAVAILPALLTPPLLLLVPVRDPLPILVGGPLAFFFAIYGLLTLIGLALARLARLLRREQDGAGPRVGLAQGLGIWRRGVMMSLAVALLVVGYVFLGFGLPSQLALLNYFPPAPRLPVFLAVLGAMLPYFLADEAFTRRPGAPSGAYAITKLCFLLALAAAIVLNPGELFFLTLIAPIFVLYFAVYGLFSGIIWRRTNALVPGALANSVIFAWIVAAVFPFVG